jgi:hypothetical protein
MRKKNEAHFKAKVKDRLDSLGDDCFYFIKEAKALRGLADIFGWYKGKPFAWELKKSYSESLKDRDGHALQKYMLSKASRAGGLGRFVYPENFEECWDELVA